MWSAAARRPCPADSRQSHDSWRLAERLAAGQPHLRSGRRCAPALGAEGLCDLDDGIGPGPRLGPARHQAARAIEQLQHLQRSVPRISWVLTVTSRGALAALHRPDAVFWRFRADAAAAVLQVGRAGAHRELASLAALETSSIKMGPPTAGLTQHMRACLLQHGGRQLRQVQLAARCMQAAHRLGQQLQHALDVLVQLVVRGLPPGSTTPAEQDPVCPLGGEAVARCCRCTSRRPGASCWPVARAPCSHGQLSSRSQTARTSAARKQARLMASPRIGLAHTQGPRDVPVLAEHCWRAACAAPGSGRLQQAQRKLIRLCSACGRPRASGCCCAPGTCRHMCTRQI